MGQRGEVFSTRVFADEGKKTFFFNVKENRYGDLYINIAESRKSDNGFRRSSIVIFEENMDEFTRILEHAVDSARDDRPSVQSGLETDGGRRIYQFRSDDRSRNQLKITEMRSDDTGDRRESIFVPREVFNEFLSAYRKALSAAGAV